MTVDDILFDACSKNDLIQVKKLLFPRILMFKLDAKVDVNATKEDGITPLHVAIACDSKEYSNKLDELLISAGANVNATDKGGKTPLHIAAETGVGRAGLLIANGANVDMTDNDGETPLHKAAKNGRNYMVVLLITNRANINTSNKDGKTPLHMAVKKGSKEIVEYLVANGANVNMIDKDGDTPLQLSLKLGQKEITKLLLVSDIVDAKRVSDALSKFLDEGDDNAKLEQVKIIKAMGQHSLIPLLQEAFDEYGDPSRQNINIYKIRLATWCGCALHPAEFGYFFRTQYQYGRSPMLDEMRTISMKDGMNGQTYVHILLETSNDAKSSSRGSR